MVAQADSTLTAIRTKVRRLTASASESSLSTDTIDQYINTFYNQDFPYAIKLDQMRSVYTFFTSPNVDRYPLDINYNQGVREPVYFEGIRGYFFKDRGQFYNMWPRWPTKFERTIDNTTGNISDANQANPCQITSPNHDLSTDDMITIYDVVGMTELNGNSYTITVTGTNTFTLNGIDSSLFTAYVSGGLWYKYVTFTLGATPFLSTMVVMGGTDENGNIIRIVDDGGILDTRGNFTTTGNLLLLSSDNVGDFDPVIPPTSPIPNTSYAIYPAGNNIGTVNYVTGEFSFFLPVNLESGTQLTIWVSQYSSARPYTVLFWNNEFQIRPVPDNVYKVELETYLTPTQFMETTDNPTLNQWWQYIAIGAAIKVLEDRQDFDGVSNLMPMFQRQESLVLERQGVEEIGQRNATLYSSTVMQQGWNNGFGQGWY
jgi:hypothetical protein